MTQQHIVIEDPVKGLAEWVKTGANGPKPPCGVSLSAGYHVGVIMGTGHEAVKDLPVLGDILKGISIGMSCAEMKANQRRAAMIVQNESPHQTATTGKDAAYDAGVLCQATG